MAYARLQTRNTSGLHPNLRGIAPNPTTSSAGLRPEFRGLGQAGPTTTFSIGPGGQYSLDVASTPNEESLTDQFLTWLSQPSAYVPGMPNSVLVGAGVIVAFVLISRGGRRR